MTRKRVSFGAKQWLNKYVLKLFLNTPSDEADVLLLGRPFHTFAPATQSTTSDC